MITKSFRLEDLERVKICLGYVGENEHTQVRIDCASAFAEYPGATPALAVKPPRGGIYPAVIETDGNTVVWTVTNSDLLFKGDGEIQFSFSLGDVIKKTAVGKFTVKRSIITTANVPDPVAEWLIRATAAAAAAEAAAEHQPKIENEYWYVWDADAEDYVSTGIKAKGDKGDPGTPGDPTQLIDDETPASNKTFSSSKVNTELTGVKSAIQKKQDKPYTFAPVSGVNLNRSYVLYNGEYKPMGTQNLSFVVSDPVSVVAGDKIFVNARANWSNDWYVFYGANGAVVAEQKCDSTGTTLSDFSDVVVVPSGATSIRVATKTLTDSSLPENPFVLARSYEDVNIKDILNDVETIQTDMEAIQDSYPVKPVYDDIPFTEKVGFFIAKSGAVTSAPGTSYLASDYVDVSEHETVIISASGNWENALWAFYDENKNVVKIGTLAGNSSAYTDITDEEVSVPINAKYIYVCGRTNHAGPAIKVFSGYEPLNKWYGKKWACVGDSLTERNSRTTKNYADYVSKATDITIVNMGVSGTGYKRTEGSNTAFYQRILNIPTDVDVVTIFGSGNDLSGMGTFSDVLGTPSDNTTDTICGCINQTIDNLYSVLPTVQLGIITPCPWESYPPYSTGNNMELYAAAIVAICNRRGIPCLDLYHCSAMRPWESEFRTLCYSKDEGNGTHPDETGHKILAPHFEEFLEQLII